MPAAEVRVRALYTDDVALRLARALAAWDARSGLDRIESRTLIIAAQRDYAPIAEKRALAAKLKASMVEVEGSRHGTPFDASDATNRVLVSFLIDRSIEPRRARRSRYAYVPATAPRLERARDAVMKRRR